MVPHLELIARIAAGAAFGGVCAKPGAVMAASSVVARSQLFNERLDIDILPVLDSWGRAPWGAMRAAGLSAHASLAAWPVNRPQACSRLAQSGASGLIIVRHIWLTGVSS